MTPETTARLTAICYVQKEEPQSGKVNMDVASQILRQRINTVVKELSKYIEGNKQEINKLEKAIEDVDDKLRDKLYQEQPSRILEYLLKKVELKLKLEELKVAKGSSIPSLLKNWGPILTPLLVGVMAFIGVLMGLDVNKRNQPTISNDSKVNEYKLVTEIFKNDSPDKTYKKLSLLFEAGYFFP